MSREINSKENNGLSFSLVLIRRVAECLLLAMVRHYSECKQHQLNLSLGFNFNSNPHFSADHNFFKDLSGGL